MKTSKISKEIPRKVEPQIKINRKKLQRKSQTGFKKLNM